jgi:hypothetical protein
LNSGASVKLVYWAEQVGEDKLHDLNGIGEFREELEQVYATAVHSRLGDLGGLLHMAVEFVSSISMGDVAQFLLSGMAYDLIKGGTKSLVLRPFIQAYQRLEERNRDLGLDIDVFRIVMRDSIIVIYRLSDGSILGHLEKVLVTAANEYPQMVLRSGEKPYEIHVPVFKDATADRLSRYRVLLDVDETIEPKPARDYFTFWGLQYDFSGTTRVYDLRRHLLIDEEFLTQERYDTLWYERYRRLHDG